MNYQLHGVALVLAGRRVDDASDRVRRYCGLPWPGGKPETWAYRYYDAVETDPQTVTAVDVLTAAALHPGLSRTDLAYFHERATELAEWLAGIPTEAALRDADDTVLQYLSDLSTWKDAPSVSLLSKVLHRKRPALIPLVDRHILDWYRPVTGERSPSLAWAPLLRALRNDLGGENTQVLATMSYELEKDLGRTLSDLRVLDIAVWMGGRR